MKLIHVFVLAQEGVSKLERATEWYLLRKKFNKIWNWALVRKPVGVWKLILRGAVRGSIWWPLVPGSWGAPAVCLPLANSCSSSFRLQDRSAASCLLYDVSQRRSWPCSSFQKENVKQRRQHHLGIWVWSENVVCWGDTHQNLGFLKLKMTTVWKNSSWC